MEQAIRLNGADVGGTLRAFRLGRLYFADPEMVGSLIVLGRGGDANVAQAL
jgi:indolepyruvate ferredoxin oxidoreductase